MPHCTPPLVPPLPTRVCHSISPFRSGSSPKTTPDFCPTSRMSRPLGSFSVSTEDPKSKSGPGHVVPVHAPLKTSPGVICLDHTIFPVFNSIASTESLISLGGDEKLSPVVTYSNPRLV